MIVNCLSCGRRVEVSGAYYCKSADGQLSLILKPAGMAGKDEVKAALSEEGIGCSAYAKSVVDVKKKESSTLQSSSLIPSKPIGD